MRFLARLLATILGIALVSTGAVVALPSAALATTALPSLSGEYLSQYDYSYASTYAYDQTYNGTNYSGSGSYAYGTPSTNRLSTNGTCGASTVTLTYDTSGPANGPYTGTFRQSGTVTFHLVNPYLYEYNSPPAANYQYHYRSGYGSGSGALRGTFSVDSPAGTVNGSMDGQEVSAYCYESQSTYSAHYSDDYWTVNADSTNYYNNVGAYGQANWTASIAKDGALRGASGYAFVSLNGYADGGVYDHEQTSASTNPYYYNYHYKSAGNYTSQSSSAYVSFTEVASNAAPTVAISGVTDGGTYDRGSVPAVSCSATDAEDGSTAVAAQVTGPVGPRAADGLGVVTVTCSYTDTGRLTRTATASYTINDQVGPVLSLPGTIVQEATSAVGASVSFSARAQDAVDGARTTSCLPASSSTFSLGDTTVSCTASDASGNASNGTFTVSVQDTTAPVISADSVVAAATSASGAVVTYTATASDLVDGSVAATCAPASGSQFALGVTAVICVATDAAHNSASSGLSVTVQDKAAPVVDTPSNVTAEATGPSGAPIRLPVVPAADDVDGALTAACLPGSGVFALGTTTVTCTATDRAANKGTSTFSVLVADTTAPLVTAPADRTAEATTGLGAEVSFAAATATDAVSGSPAATCDRTSASTFPLGFTVVTCTATDAAKNTGTATFAVTVQDTTAPAVTAPANETTEATSPAGATVNYSGASASDLVNGQVSTTCVRASGATFPLGTTTVTCTATDVAGNAGHASFTVTVVDTTAPVLSTAANQVVAAAGPTGAVATFSSATASDAADTAPVVTCTSSSGSQFPLGVTTIACKAIDLSGNSSANSFTITVQDQGKPIVSVPTDKVVEATSAAGAIGAWGAASALDDVDGVIAVSCDRQVGSQFPLGTTTVTCTATDQAGNSGKNTFTVTVTDRTAPTLTVSANVAATATSRSGAAVSYSAASAADLVDGATVTSCDRASGSLFALGTTTVTCSSTDRAGNAGTKSFTVTVTYGFGGFADPVVDGRTFKLGSTIPVKFALTGASAAISNANARLFATQTGAASATTPVTVVASGSANTGNAFRYDGGQYVFNLSTKNLTAGAWRLRVDLGDGVVRDVGVQLRP